MEGDRGRSYTWFKGLPVVLRTKKMYKSDNLFVQSYNAQSCTVGTLFVDNHHWKKGRNRAVTVQKG